MKHSQAPFVGSQESWVVVGQGSMPSLRHIHAPTAIRCQPQHLPLEGIDTLPDRQVESVRMTTSTRVAQNQ